MLRKLIYLIIFFFGTINCFAQDIHLSQFFNAPLLRNPALAGIFTGDIRVQAVYRNQWQSIGYPYRTNALGLEYKFRVGNNDDYMTIGSSFFYDQAGIMKLKTLQVMPVINFHKSINQEKSQYISAGFMAGFVSRQFDGKNLTFDNQYTGGVFNQDNPSGEPFVGLSRNVFDMAAGISFNSSVGDRGNMYIGTSLWHFNKPTYGFMSNEIQLDPKLQFNAALKTWVNDQVTLTFEGNYLTQGTYEETIAGGLVHYYFDYTDYENSVNSGLGIGGGLLTRMNDAIIPHAQISYNHFDIGLSYDINTSSLRVGSQGQGGIEFSVSYRAFVSGKKEESKRMRCPKF